jgi:hypothetical protein
MTLIVLSNIRQAISSGSFTTIQVSALLDLITDARMTITIGAVAAVIPAAMKLAKDLICMAARETMAKVLGMVLETVPINWIKVTVVMKVHPLTPPMLLQAKGGAAVPAAHAKT